jgi:tetratricopeptide (TPR) repeat protein
MDRPRSFASKAVVAAMTLGVAMSASAADVDIEAALARVDAIRLGADPDPQQLERALTVLGDSYLNANQYAKAEPAYAEALRLAERNSGPESVRVLAPLLGVGRTLAGSGHHEEAVPQLQRALTIERAQYGLFDLRQQDTLEMLAASLTALDRMPEARDLMLYRVRVAEKTFGEANPKVIPVLCDLGDWFAENLLSLDARMTFQMALNIVGTSDSLNDPIIVEPLRGIARTRMRAQSYPSERWVASPLRPHESHVPRYSNLGVPLPGPDYYNREGEEALQRAVRILDSDPSASTPATRIETLIQMGDWYQIKKSPREALPYYQRAWQLMRSSPGLPDSVTTALDVPVRVYYPTPPIVTYVPVVPPEDTRFHHVEVEFTVLADGSVRNARMVAHDTRERYARDILGAVRKSRFRPKFVDGQPVAVPEITYREVFWTGKPRT